MYKHIKMREDWDQWLAATILLDTVQQQQQSSLIQFTGGDDTEQVGHSVTLSSVKTTVYKKLC